MSRPHLALLQCHPCYPVIAGFFGNFGPYNKVNDALIYHQTHWDTIVKQNGLIMSLSMSLLTERDVCYC